MHERPTFVQEVTWRPSRVTSIEPDPLAEMILTFSAGRLARIAVSLARDLLRRIDETAAIQARAEKIRQDNKAKFKP